MENLEKMGRSDALALAKLLMFLQTVTQESVESGRSLPQVDQKFLSRARGRDAALGLAGGMIVGGFSMVLFRNARIVVRMPGVVTGWLVGSGLGNVAGRDMALRDLVKLEDPSILGPQSRYIIKKFADPKGYFATRCGIDVASAMQMMENGDDLQSFSDESYDEEKSTDESHFEQSSSRFTDLKNKWENEAELRNEKAQHPTSGTWSSDLEHENRDRYKPVDPFYSGDSFKNDNRPDFNSGNTNHSEGTDWLDSDTSSGSNREPGDPFINTGRGVYDDFDSAWTTEHDRRNEKFQTRTWDDLRREHAQN